VPGASSAARLAPDVLLKTISRAAIASERSETALARLLERLGCLTRLLDFFRRELD